MDERTLEKLDQLLCEHYDATFREGAGRAGAWVTCKPGCTACCIGPFAISALDAWRLQRGLAALAAADPQAAARVRERAQAQWRILAPELPGETRTGALVEDGEAQEAFFARFAHLPCPLLEPETGLCALYRFRPASCRSFGLPCRIGATLLPPCPRNFVGAPEAALAQATVTFDPEDREGELLAAFGNPPETVVAAVIAGVYPAPSPGEQSENAPSLQEQGAACQLHAARSANGAG
jgi:Fe-S-cluster containining protein